MDNLAFIEVKANPELLLAGDEMIMSYVNNRTAELWKNFMSRYRPIGLLEGKILYSVEIYDTDFFSNFSPEHKFIKWAAIERPDLTKVNHSIEMIDGMKTLLVPAGNYAVFNYKGSSADASKVFGYIYGEWLPASAYNLDQRPHFQKLGNKYRNNHEDSEEEIWIPVTLKT